MGAVVLMPSLGSRFARLILASESKNETLGIIQNMELLFELGLFNPPDELWPLLQKLVEKHVALLALNDK